MKKYLGILALALGMLLRPREAQAVSCPVVQTFVNGQTLTASTLNANPTQFASCLQNIDYRNMGSAGIFASQIIPQTTSQATFGGSIPYTFTVSPNFNAPLTQANGGTGSANGSVNGVSFSNTGYTAGTTGLVTDGYNINLDANGTSGIGIGYDDSSLRSIQFGPGGNWSTMNGTGWTYNGNFTLGGTGNYFTAQNFLANQDGQYQLTNGTQLNSIFMESNGNIGFYNNTGNYDTGVQVDITNGYLISNENRVNVPNLSSLYTVPFDGNSISGSRYTHYEHGSATTAAVSGNYGCTSTISYQVGFAAAPHITLTLASGITTAKILYYQNRTTSGFQACVYEPTASSDSGQAIDWLAAGE